MHLPAHSETSSNLINNDNWNGAAYGNDPGGCCASISGSGALYDNLTDTIMFSYGEDILSQTIAINEALKSSGIEVDGYNYMWTFRKITNNGRDGDTLRFEVQVKDSNGNAVENYSYDYSNDGSYIPETWYTESGTETFAQSYLDPQNIQLRIIGKDGGFWGGYYGPEIKDVSLTLNYTANPCATNPLYDPSCSGWAEAYAQLIYDHRCADNPLYDMGCAGYEQAYLDQQCSINPLYDSGCPGYAQAYYDQQCSIDPLYDAGCPGYAQAYYDQQCSIDPLYDTGCPGYAQAYLDQQCGLDPLYDATCPGYAEAYYAQQCGLDALYDSGCDGYQEAYATKYLLPNSTTTESTTTPSVTTSEPVIPITDPEKIAIPSATGDSTVDSILTDLAETPTIAAIEQPSNDMPTQERTEEKQDETSQAEPKSESEPEPMESAGGGDNESSDESKGEDSNGGDSKSEKKDSKSDKKESKRDKMKKEIAKKAAGLADKMSEAASLEAQQAMQAQVLALINYTPGFNDYQRSINGGYLPDANGYPETKVPESRRGLRNGLAQQILHEKMVQMQYERGQ